MMNAGDSTAMSLGVTPHSRSAHVNQVVPMNVQIAKTTTSCCSAASGSTMRMAGNGYSNGTGKCVVRPTTRYGSSPVSQASAPQSTCDRSDVTPGCSARSQAAQIAAIVPTAIAKPARLYAFTAAASVPRPPPAQRRRTPTPALGATCRCR
jgi:hypothetical protein